MLCRRRVHDRGLFETAIGGLQKSTEAQGLKIYPDKTPILTNQKTDKLREIEIDEMHVEILLVKKK